MENVLKLAGKIAKNAPIAVRNCKKAINDGISLPIEKAVEVEEKLFGDCFETHDQKEGMACFLSREKPKMCIRDRSRPHRCHQEGHGKDRPDR